MIEFSLFACLLLLGFISISLFKLAFAQNPLENVLDTDLLLESPMLVLDYQSPILSTSAGQSTLTGVCSFEALDIDGRLIQKGSANLAVTLPTALNESNHFKIVLHSGALSSYTYQLPTGGHLSNELLNLTM